MPSRRYKEFKRDLSTVLNEIFIYLFGESILSPYYID